MKRFFQKPFRWAGIYGTVLTLFFVYVLLDAFVIPRAQMRVADAAPLATSAIPSATAEDEPFAAPTATASPDDAPDSDATATDKTHRASGTPNGKGIPKADGARGKSENAKPEGTSKAQDAESPSDAQKRAGSSADAADSGVADDSSSAPEVTATSYRDENVQITIETLRESDTTFYVADIRLSDPTYLRTALAGDTFGRNIKSSTSEMADRVNAIFAINGDYYGSRDAGWVLRNGVLYRDTSSGGEALVIDSAGNLSIADENAMDVSAIADAWQIFSFGPALVNGGEIAVEVGEEINGKASNSNPRTAIGQAGEGHYIVIVSDGRTSSSAGFSLYQLAQAFVERGCSVAYNLDGGGSSTMIFCGAVINQPVGGRGSSGTERRVSDIVYIGA